MGFLQTGEIDAMLPVRDFGIGRGEAAESAAGERVAWRFSGLPRLSESECGLCGE